MQYLESVVTMLGPAGSYKVFNGVCVCVCVCERKTEREGEREIGRALCRERV